MDLIFNQSSTEAAPQDPIRFVFWLVLMVAVVGILTYICYVAWQGDRRMRQDGQRSKSRNESSPDPDASARKAER